MLRSVASKDVNLSENSGGADWLYYGEVTERLKKGANTHTHRTLRHVSDVLVNLT